MKKPQEFPAWLLRQLLISAALLLAAGCATGAPVASSGILSAKVAHLKGGARYKTANNDWRPLKAGDMVKPGTLIQTAAKGRVDLVLGAEMLSHRGSTEQSTLRLYANTLLGIDSLTGMETGADVVTETQLDLKAGHIYGVVKQMSAASKYEVKIPNGVIGVRGTVYDLTAKGDVKVLSGSVVLAYVAPDGTVATQVFMGSPKSAPWTGAPTSTLDPWRNLPVSRRF
jgi:hypothetical protein